MGSDMRGGLGDLQSGQGAQRGKFMDRKRGMPGNTGSREDLNVGLDALIDRDKNQAGFKRQRRDTDGLSSGPGTAGQQPTGSYMHSQQNMSQMSRQGGYTGSAGMGGAKS